MKRTVGSSSVGLMQTLRFACRENVVEPLGPIFFFFFPFSLHDRKSKLTSSRLVVPVVSFAWPRTDANANMEPALQMLPVERSLVEGSASMRRCFTN